MIRIAHVSASPLSNASWWRSLGPLIELSRMDPRFDVSAPPQIDWAALRRYDAVFLLLPNCGEQAVNLVIEARSAGVKVIADVDDLYTEVPRGHPCLSEWTGNRLAVLRALQSMADLVFVPTETLKAALLEQGVQNVVVAPNAWPDRMEWPQQQERQKLVLWRGGDLHDADISPVAKEIADAMPTDWRFAVMGGHEPAAVIEAFGDRVDVYPKAEIGYFHRMIVDLRPAVVVHPLIDSRFNRCRSNISYLEATYAGAVLVAPAFEEFTDLPCFSLYGGEVSLKQAMCLAITDAQTNAVKRSRTYIDDHMRMTHANLIRVKALEALFDL